MKLVAVFRSRSPKVAMAVAPRCGSRNGRDRQGAARGERGASVSVVHWHPAIPVGEAPQNSTMRFISGNYLFPNGWVGGVRQAVAPPGSVPAAAPRSPTTSSQPERARQASPGRSAQSSSYGTRASSWRIKSAWFRAVNLRSSICVANRNHRRLGSQSSVGRAHDHCNGVRGGGQQNDDFGLGMSHDIAL